MRTSLEGAKQRGKGRGYSVCKGLAGSRPWGVWGKWVAGSCGRGAIGSEGETKKLRVRQMLMREAVEAAWLLS